MYEQIASNRRRTWLLIAGAFVLLGALGLVVGYFFGSSVVGLAVALIVAAVMGFTSYRFGDRVVLASARAQEVSAADQPRLHNIVEGLSIAAGIPKPRVYLIPEKALNAFATGRDPEHASVAVTVGLLESLNRVELEGVIGHELAHIVDRDILVGTLAATLAGAVVLLAEWFARAWWWGGIRGRRDSSGGGIAGLVIAVVGIALLVLAPLFAQIIRFSVSRQREYLADAQGALLTRYPPGLASALRKIRDASGIPMRTANDATAHLFLNRPSRVEGERMGRLERLFSTHPPIEDRIRRLEEM